MGDSKPALQSVTLWANLVMAALAFFVPAEYLSGEYKAMIVAGVNGLIRYFLTRKEIKGLV